MSWVFITTKSNAKAAKTFFEQEGQYDKDRKMAKFSEEEVMIPIKEELAEQINRRQTQPTERSLILPVEGKIQYTTCTDFQNINQHKISPREKIKVALRNMLQKKGVTFEEVLHEDLPCHWEQHGDLILFPEKSFILDVWEQCGVDLWKLVAETLGVRRLAKKSTIRSDGFRTPRVDLLYGNSGWVTHIDNGIKYTFDVTKCMFSAGNITEKIRVGKFNCEGQTVVDLYAGIGYFVLPYLVHAKAAIVHACEWNENAIKALKKNVKLNGVEEQCVIYEGDNQKFPLHGVADHVNLGLIPSSEPGWPVACAALRSDSGGWLHVHGNVTSRLTSNEERVAAIFPPNETKSKEKSSNQLSTGSEVCVTEQASLPMNLKCSEKRISSLSKMEKTPSSNKKLKPEWLDWALYVTERLFLHLTKSHKNKIWNVQIQHIEHVKSYAPHIDHLVLDVECRPLKTK